MFLIFSKSLTTYGSIESFYDDIGTYVGYRGSTLSSYPGPCKHEAEIRLSHDLIRPRVAGAHGRAGPRRRGPSR